MSVKRNNFQAQCYYGGKCHLARSVMCLSCILVYPLTNPFRIRTHKPTHLSPFFQSSSTQEIAPRQQTSYTENEVRPKYRVYFSCTSGVFLLLRHSLSLLGEPPSRTRRRLYTHTHSWFSDSFTHHLYNKTNPPQSTIYTVVK